tara:strand:- start:8854 stop:9942 length:1089 start_codon:yes stop_codon:yes gene_type:complete
MAIDSRIALNLQPLNVGERFAQNIQNLQQQDLLNSRREQAPLIQEQLQLQTDLARAQQPANLLAAESAAGSESQLINQQQQAQQIATSYANALRPVLNNPQALVQELQRQKLQFQNAGVDTRGIDDDILQAQTPEGLALLTQEIDDTLTTQGPQAKFAPQISPVQTDIETGQKFIIKTDRNTGESERVDVKGAKGRTPEQDEQAVLRSSLLGDAAKVSKESFDQLKGIRSSISTIDEAISEIDKGASTGIVDKYLPSFRESTIALENAAQRMGLDVISATTFGALSEGELKLAMDTAMPRNLQPKALKKWLIDRKKAKVKLSRELTKMAITLGKGKTTIAEYLEKNASFDERSDEDILAEYF